jgi:hypothetical protein
MLLSQYRDGGGSIRVVARSGTEAYQVETSRTLYDIALACADEGQRLSDRVAALGLGAAVDLDRLYADGRLLPPVLHPDPAHLHLTGTGLTHLGSASARDAMHANAGNETDSMRMFRMGAKGGKPPNGHAGVRPEWFYKGTGAALANPGAPVSSPAFAEDGGEEPEIAGIYVIGRDGTPFRLGFALANEFSDRVVERRNHLYLAHSKLRPASLGPELLVGDLPHRIEGVSRVRRGAQTIFERPFLSGEVNMSHSIANLEHHHFKYEIFRQPGDVHVHMFGTATPSFAEGVACESGDIFEIEASAFGLPLRNRLSSSGRPTAEPLTEVRAL